MKSKIFIFYFLTLWIVSKSTVIFADSPQNSLSTHIQPRAGFIDIHGKVVIPIAYDSVGEFHEGLAWVQNNKKFGYIDTAGNVAIEIKFDAARNFEEGLAIAKTNKKFGLIDKTGSFVIPAEFDAIRNFSEDFAAAKDGKFWGFINKKGEWVIKPEYDEVGNFSEDLASVSIKGGYRYYFIDKRGKTIIPDQGYLSDYFPIFLNGFAKFDRTSGAPSTHWEYYFDKNGKLVFQKTTQNTIANMENQDGRPILGVEGEPISGEGAPITTIDVNLLKNKKQELPFTEGLSLLRDNAGIGFCDENGKVVIKPKFKDASNFSKGLARVEYKNKWGFINHQGNWVVNPIYFEAGNFNGNFAYVKKDDKIEGFIDTKGNFFPAPYLKKYSSSKIFSEGFMDIREKNESSR